MKIEAHRKILFFAIVLVLLSPLPANAGCGDGSFSDFKLTADTPVPNAQFGHTVAVSGDTMVVGAPVEPGNSPDQFGAAYVFIYDEDQDSWIQKQKLEVEGSAVFGWSVAIDGDTLVVGDYFENSAYVFRYDEDLDSWIEEKRLTVPIPVMLGFSVAVSGDTVVVGTLVFFGDASAYVFRRKTGPEWSQEGLLTGTRGFGWAVAISGDTLVVGNPFTQSAQVFTRNDSIQQEPIWTEDKTLTTGKAVGDFFGVSVAIDIDDDTEVVTVVVGAPPYLNVREFTPPVDDPGSAHAFSWRELEEGTWQWVEDEKLPLSQEVNGFGLSVAISSDRLVVGAPTDTDDEGTITGAAYLFKYDDSNWVEDPVQPKLIPTTEPGLREGDQFGWSVAIDASTIAVGAPLSNLEVPDQTDVDLNNEVLKAGAAYVFTANDETPVSVVQSTLGRSRHRFFPAWEIFEFTAAEGDKATLIFEADPNGSNNHGKGVSIFVKDKIRGERFFMKKRWALGDPMHMQLPADGKYRVFVFGHPWFFRSKGFRGDYVLKLEVKGTCAELTKVVRRKKCRKKW